MNNMPTRKELRGAAAGIAGRFVSRNNDINGYWAMGMLYKSAADAGENKFTLNILNGESSSYFKCAKHMNAEIHSMLLKQLDARGFEEFNVIDAVVELEFNINFSHQHNYPKTNLGEPFSCRVILTDDLNRQRIYEESGRCRQHDPSKELQSTRVYAS